MTFAEKNPRFDLLTGEAIPFKTKERYLSSYFKDRITMRKWYKETARENAQQKTIEMIINRCKVKKILWGLSEVELRTSPLPTASLLYLVGIHYDDIIKRAGLKKRFEYKNFSLAVEADDLNKKTTIIQDTREKLPLKSWSKNIEVEIKKLNYGDYAPKENPAKLFVDRKSMGDLIGSLSSGNFDRVCREIQRAKDDGAYLFFVVEHAFQKALCFEHSYSGKFAKASPDYIFSQLREIMQNFDNVQFAFVPSREESCAFIEYLFKLGERAKHYDWQFLINLKKAQKHYLAL